jgi:ComF family protein
VGVISAPMIRSILDLTLPRECPACRVRFEGNSCFCADCEQEFQTLESKPRCRRCSMPATLPGAPCAQCLGKGLSPFDLIVSLGVLKDPLKSAVHRAKYEHRWPLAERLADRLLLRSDLRSTLENADVLVPVPLHRKKQRERGYNQAEVIARRLGRASKVAVVIAAGRIRATESQAQIHAHAARIDNLKGAFAMVNAAAIAGKHVVLVDDVLTSGATLISLARVLKSAKPASLSAIVLAVADPKGRAFEVI